MSSTPLSPTDIQFIIRTHVNEVRDRLENERSRAPRTEAEAEARAMTHDAAAADLKRALRCNDPTPVAAIAEALRMRYPNLPAPGGPEYQSFARQLMLAELALHKESAACERGEYAPDMIASMLGAAVPAMQTAPVAYAPVPPGQVSYADMLFEEVYNLFIRTKTGAPWRAETVRDAKNARDNFLQIIGNKRVRDVTVDDAVRFRDTLKRLPKLIGRSVFRIKVVDNDGHPILDARGRPTWKTLSVQEAIAKADSLDEERTAEVKRRLAAGKIDPDNLEDELRKARVPRLSPKTVNKHFDLVSQLWKWISDTRKQPLQNVFYKGRCAIDGDARDERPMHTRAQIRALFASPAWTGCSHELRRALPGPLIIKDAFYWIPLVIAHQGARLEEVSQLKITDVFEIGGIWCITIRGGGGRRVKNRNAYRTLPIHPLLVELGFVEYVKRMKAAGKVRVFPRLRRDSRERLGGMVSKWFTNYRRTARLYEPGRDGHALRHSFNTYLERAFVMVTRRKELMGHAHEGETDGRYLKPAKVRALFDDLKKLDYGIRTEVRNGQTQISRALSLAVEDLDDDE